MQMRRNNIIFRRIVVFMSLSPTFTILSIRFLRFFRRDAQVLEPYGYGARFESKR